MRGKKGIIGLLLLSLFALGSCGTKYFYHESENKAYTELHLNSNGSFKEYIYLNVKDSLIQEDFGNVISGTYDFNGDTLFLKYDESNGLVALESTANAQEVYLKQGKNLVKLEPITYSHHFLNMIFIAGKSSYMRNLPQYNTIIWKPGF